MVEVATKFPVEIHVEVVPRLSMDRFSEREFQRRRLRELRAAVRSFTFHVRHLKRGRGAIIRPLLIWHPLLISPDVRNFPLSHPSRASTLNNDNIIPYIHRYF